MLEHTETTKRNTEAPEKTAAEKQEYRIIGKSVPQLEASRKARGTVLFTDEMKLSGMLYGKIKRCPYPFARIISIDISEAQKVPGVRAVITGRDVRQFPQGMIIKDEMPLARDVARYAGDEVAAVAADDEETAKKAVDLIKVEYEVLKPLLDLAKAMDPDAPQVHPELKGIQNNVANRIAYERGGVDEGFQKADLILQDRFSTQLAHQGYIEPQSSIASWEATGKLTIWGPLQCPFRFRMYLAEALGVPEYQIRVVQAPIGGGFGGKGEALQSLFPISAWLSQKTGRPVKITLTRDEDFISSRPRIGQIIDMKIGFKKDGAIVAKETRIIGDSGAYTGLCPALISVSSHRHDGIYRIPAVRMEANLVYTNTIPRGAYRGFGNPQPLFAMECLMDMAAEKLGLDPSEIRLRNAAQKGDVNIHGWILNTCGLTDSINLAAEMSGWKDKRKSPKKYHGIGMACQVHVCGNRAINPLYDGSAAYVLLDHDGRVRINSGEGDIGQGANTLFAQIAAEELGVDMGDVEVLPLDTDYAPFCQGAWGTRITTLGGGAVQMAARDARNQLVSFVAGKVKTDPDNIVMRDKKFYRRDTDEELGNLRQMAYEAIFRQGGTPITGIGRYVVPDSVVAPDVRTKYGNYSPAYEYGTEVAEVTVDPDTGKVDVLDIWFAEDIGRALNPRSCEGQLEGGVVQGMGYVLTESYHWDNGIIINPSLMNYKMPSSHNAPRVHTRLIETYDPVTIYGAKGVGEPPLNPTPPAIANAIYHAIGVRIKDMPITPDKILKALEEKGQK